MKEIKIELESICPLLMDKWTGDNPKTDQEAQKQAPNKAYRDAKGNLCIEARALKAVIREASAIIGKKVGRTERRELIQASVFIEPEFLSLGKKDYDCIDGRLITRRDGRKLTRVMTYRPLVKGWNLTATISLMDGVTPDFIKECLEVAGWRRGFYGYRPDFGRFIVKKFEVKK